MIFRIFSNDRSATKYSALLEVSAADAAAAEKKARAKNPPLRQPWGTEKYKAIAWPVSSLADRLWVAKHVGGGR